MLSHAVAGGGVAQVPSVASGLTVDRLVNWSAPDRAAQERPA